MVKVPPQRVDAQKLGQRPCGVTHNGESIHISKSVIELNVDKTVVQRSITKSWRKVDLGGGAAPELGSHGIRGRSVALQGRTQPPPVVPLFQ